MILGKTDQVFAEGVHAMTALHFIYPARFLSEQLERASPDLMRQMLTTFINSLMSAEAALTSVVATRYLLGVYDLADGETR